MCANRRRVKRARHATVQPATPVHSDTMRSATPVHRAPQRGRPQTWSRDDGWVPTDMQCDVHAFGGTRGGGGDTQLDSCDGNSERLAWLFLDLAPWKLELNRLSI